MTFGINPIDDKMCDVILYDTTASALSILQVAETFCTMTATSVYSVANEASLPSAACNKGRFVFLNDKCSYRYSDGVSWTNDASSLPAPPLWSWGYNTTGQLGDNTTVSKSSPVSVVGGINSWSQICAGAIHSLGIRSNGTLWAWGCNSQGRLGDNTTTDRSSPVSVVGGFTDWCQVSANSQSLGVRTNGTAWAWGSNLNGQLGDNTVVSKSSPVQICGGFTDWCQVSAGARFSLGVRTNGTAWAWGFNDFGRLGDGTVTGRISPVQVCGGFTNWSQISAGYSHGIGLRTNGTLWAWGWNSCGQLGDGTVVNKSSPVSVVGGFIDWCQVSAGYRHNIGLRTNGTAWAWGYNTTGQLGDNTTTNKSSPVSIVGGFTDWCQIETGNYHNIGLRTNGTAWAWGSNTYGRLGDNTTTNRSSPVSISGSSANWSQVSAGSNHSSAIRISKGFTAI